MNKQFDEFLDLCIKHLRKHTAYTGTVFRWQEGADFVVVSATTVKGQLIERSIPRTVRFQPKSVIERRVLGVIADLEEKLQKALS